MEPGLRALLHANQPGLLPSFPPPACLPRSLLLAGRMASPALRGPSAAGGTAPAIGGTSESSGGTAQRGRRHPGDLAGCWVSVVEFRPRPRRPGWQ